VNGREEKEDEREVEEWISERGEVERVKVGEVEVEGGS
jgi:hypothetical protein